MKAKYQRMLWIILMLLGVGTGIFFILLGFRENIVYFQKPHEIAQNYKLNQTYRIGGIVKKGTLQIDAQTLEAQFDIIDSDASIHAYYQGVLPDLFGEDEIAIIEGHFKENGDFNATNVLAKHDENYRPPGFEK